MNTLTELVNHIKTYNDTIIIIGPGILKDNKIKYTQEEFNNTFTRKNLIRNSKKFWDFFINNIYKKQDNNEIYKKIESISHSIIVTQNTNTPNLDNIIHLHGTCSKYYCSKCDTMYSEDYIFSKEPYENKCEVCGKILKPTVLLSNENYNSIDFEILRKNIENTHTIFLIGVDYTENALLDLLIDYNNIKTLNNLNDENDKKILVSLENKENNIDLSQYVFPEFLVKDDISLGLDRFLKEYYL